MIFPIPQLIGLFAQWGLPEPLRKIAAWATAAVAIVLLLIGLKAAYDASVIREHESERAADTIEARDDAAGERADDAIRQAEEERKRNEAIDKAQGGQLSPAAHALACERLRKLGRIPPACRREGGDGAEADPR